MTLCVFAAVLSFAMQTPNRVKRSWTPCRTWLSSTSHIRIKKSAHGRLFYSGGDERIRTSDTLASIHAFQACAFNHSATSPYLDLIIRLILQFRLHRQTNPPFLRQLRLSSVHPSKHFPILRRFHAMLGLRI